MVYAIWLEGFHIQGSVPVPAFFVGFSEGNSFENAVTNWYLEHPSCSFEPATLTFWGCRHFDNELDARKSFG